jgi:predicted CXXCH cytochrome family protein
VKLWRWEALGLAALAVIVITIPLSLLKQRNRLADPVHEKLTYEFVGTAACRECHVDQFRSWHNSDHDLAMDVATDSTVLGNFENVEITHRGITSRFSHRDGRYFVWTEGPSGEMAEFEISHTFGHEPLQQYLVPFPGGRLQALTLAWDVDQQHWFHLYPDTDIPADDWLHWTRNAQNWNGMCAECHSTNLKKGYDPASETYTTTWTDIDVGCEACHGPGSGHVAWAGIPPMARPDLPNAGLVVTTADLDGARLTELCAPCHSRRAELGDYDHTGGHLLDHMLPSLLREGLYHPDGQILDEVYVYGSFLQSKMYARDVRCSDCHDSHSLQLVKQGNTLCLQCHEQQVYDSHDHHFHKKIHEGKPSDGALCVKCHMVEQPYMVIDWRADHSFRVPRPDLSAQIGTPNACTQVGCHDDRPLQWSVDAHRRWYGEARKPHFGTTFAAVPAGSIEVRDELIRLVDSSLQPAVVRATALEHLATFGDSTSLAAFEQAVLADEPLLRQTAASRLVEPDPVHRVEALAPLLADPLKAVRMAATSALAGTDTTLLKSYQRQALAEGTAEYIESMAYSLDFASSGLNLGNLFANLGQLDRAEYYYRLALKIDDLFLPAVMNLAVLLSGQSRNQEAEQLLRGAATAYPEDANVAYSLGLLLVEMQQPEAGLAYLRQAAELDPRGARVRYNLGLLLQQLGRLDEAEAALAAALAIEPTNLDFLYALADHLARRGRVDAALGVVERMIAAHPTQPIGHDLKRNLEQMQRARQ